MHDVKHFGVLLLKEIVEVSLCVKIFERDENTKQTKKTEMIECICIDFHSKLVHIFTLYIFLANLKLKYIYCVT